MDLDNVVRNVTHGTRARWMVKTSVLSFADCRPRFTMLSKHVQERWQFAMLFPLDDILFFSGDIREQVVKLFEI